MNRSRRTFLKESGKLSLMVVTYSVWQPVIAWGEIEATPPNDAGPFYISGAPTKVNLREAGDTGQPLHVTGKLITTQSKPLPDSRIEIWHTDSNGRYDMDGFRYRAAIPLAKDGSYEFKTFLPGQYSGRAKHIHYRISDTKDSEFFTQLYFANDPLFESAPEKHFRKDPIVRYPQLIQPVQKDGSELSVYFQIAISV